MSSTTMTFDDACDAVVSYLKDAIPLGYWSVSRFDGERQLYLSVHDEAYGTHDLDSHSWDSSLCRIMATGTAPQIAPDAMSIPEYAAAGISSQLKIGSYVGVPITNPAGELFGTLCGLDPAIQEAGLVDHAPLLELLSALLGAILAADLQRAQEARERDRLQLAAETDALTGLYNRRGWARFLASEEEQYRQFGDPGSVVILDLDGLKTVNDSGGHAAGDQMIRQCGQTVRRLIRSTDIVARLGGDEFGVLTVNTTPTQTKEFVARLRRALADEGVGCSIGFEHYGAADGFGAVWEAADQWMYADKSRRRTSSAGPST